MKKFLPPLLLLIAVLSIIGVVFRKFFIHDLVPIPYNILVGFYFPYHIGGWADYIPGIPYKGGIFAGDVFRQMIPWKQLALTVLNQGQLPLWNPYNFSGEPLLANIQATVFYPLALIFLFPWSFDTLWSWYLILSVLIGIIGNYLFLKSLNCSHTSSLISGLAFSFSGHMLSWLEWGVVTHSAIWLPYILLSLRLWLIKKRPWSFSILIFSVYSATTGGYPQESLYVLMVSFCYWAFLMISYPLKIRALITSGILGIIIFSLSLPQLLPTYRLFQASALKGHTSYQLAASTQFSPRHALTLFAPDYFGNRINHNYWADSFTKVDYTNANLFIGTPALIFACYALLHLHHRKHILFFGLLALASFVLSLNSPLADGVTHLRIPILSTGVSAGILFITVYSFTVLSGLGFNHLLTVLHWPKLIVIYSLYLALIASVLIVPPEFRSITIKAITSPSIIATILFVYLIFHFILTRINRQYTNLLLALLTYGLISIETVLYSHQMLSFSPRNYAFPSHPALIKLGQLSGLDRVAGLWDAKITTNLHTQLKLFSAEGYNPLHLKQYQYLTAASRTAGFTSQIARSDADIYPDNPLGRNRLLELTSTKFLIGKVSNPANTWEEEVLKYDPAWFTLVWQQDQFKIYRFNHSLPRVKLYSQYEIHTDLTSRIDRLYDPDFNPHQTLILETPKQLAISPTATGSANIISYQPNRVAIETNTELGNLLLLLTDTYYQSWRAFLDSQPIPIYKANQAFRAVVVPPGEHLIEYKIYWP